jgi:thiol-disulfide isomerase/thioredoxin
LRVATTTRADSGSTRRPRRLGFLAAAGVLAIAAIAAVIVAASSDPSSLTGKVDTSNLQVGPAAPALAAKGWLNSPPLTPGALTGKVVLYDFWTYSCINCVRTFPYVRAWYERYKADGLVVIGVHSPEFDFEKVHSNVAAAAKHLGVVWPVALDDDMTIWRAFQNQYWPADYVADRTGHLRYTHFGEGDYANTENVLRALIGVAANSPRASKVTNPDTASATQVNPETYLGTGQTQAAIQPGDNDYPDPGTVAAPDVALGGRWDGEAEQVTATAAGSKIVLGVHAKEVNLVLASKTGTPVVAVVDVDGHPVPAADRGAALHVDAQGRTVVTVTSPDMYRLVLAPSVVDLELTVTAQQPGLEAYDFTFG